MSTHKYKNIFFYCINFILTLYCGYQQYGKLGMITLEEIQKKLSDRNLSEVHRRTGVSYRTLFSLANGTNKNPSYESVRAIVEYLNGENK